MLLSSPLHFSAPPPFTLRSLNNSNSLATLLGLVVKHTPAGSDRSSLGQSLALGLGRALVLLIMSDGCDVL